MAAPPNAIWSMPVFSGTPAIPIATVFVLQYPTGIVVAKSGISPITIPPGGSGSFAGNSYAVANDDSRFTVVIDGSSRVKQLFTSVSEVTSLTPPLDLVSSEPPGYTSTLAQTRVGTSSNSKETSASATPFSPVTNRTEKKSVSTGVIVGIVVGVLVLLAVILGIMLLFLRRKKKQRAAKGIVLGEREGGGSDKIVVEPREVKDSPHNYTLRYTELSGDSQVQELDPASREVAMLSSNGMSGGNGQTEELYDGQHTLPSHFSDSLIPPAEVPSLASAPALSPFVEAQKKVEISWLESEEARLRQRREQLIMQSAEREP